MANVIVQKNGGDEWIVRLPEALAQSWCFSKHDTKEAAEAAAAEVAEDMGYDGVEVRT